ncbi:tyrosine-type recombinase/integrase [Nocardioides aquiterrae]|uniref:Site-specific integrase n=1 Tax=Nocardioides aquiterrae TaxID=203799 RepID=A0ABN1UET8_9ACTN
MTRERKRRQYGTGSVYQRGDGRWAGVIEAGYTARGTRRRVTVTGKTEAEAKAKLKERQRQIAAEGPPAASSRTSVKAWSDTWLEMTQRTLRPKPWATDRSAVRQWIVPTIGHKHLEQLTPADVRAVAEAQRKAGRSTSTALRTHTTLTAMLRAAITEGHQVPRRVLDVKAPTKAVSDRTAMSIPEALAMLQVASFLPHGSRWAMAFLHGMRQGECLGLTWDCVDLDAGLVTVEWELQALPYVEPRHPASGFRIPDGLAHRHLIDGFHLLPPKSKAGFRMVPLVPAMREALADWKEIAPKNPWGLVWPTVDGRPANEKQDREEWHALQGTAGVGHPGGRYYHPHEARHTTATQLLEAGVDPHQITALIGHSSILTTRLYQHPGQRASLEAMQAVAGVLELSPREVQDSSSG